MKKIIISLALTFAVALVANAESPKKKVKALKVGDAAPAFKIKDTNGKEIDLAKLTLKGPVLVRLTCGCLGCDRELPSDDPSHADVSESSGDDSSNGSDGADSDGGSDSGDASPMITAEPPSPATPPATTGTGPSSNLPNRRFKWRA